MVDLENEMIPVSRHTLAAEEVTLGNAMIPVTRNTLAAEGDDLGNLTNRGMPITSLHAAVPHLSRGTIRGMEIISVVDLSLGSGTIQAMSITSHPGVEARRSAWMIPVITTVSPPVALHLF